VSTAAVQIGTREAPERSLQHPALVHFIRSPKGILCVQLVVLALVAATTTGLRPLLQIAVAVPAAAGMDALLMWRKHPKAESLSSALLTGMILAMVLSPAEPLYVPAIGAALAILSRHLIRISGVHLFNPAALGLMTTWAVFSSQQSWWGGLSDLPGMAVVAVVALGGIIVWQVNKFPSVLAFLYVYFGLFSTEAMLGNKLEVAEIFRQPFLGTVLFFTVFMLTDPPTTPARVWHQVWFGGLVAAAAFACYLLTGGGVYYLLVALLGGNLVEGVRRAAAIHRARRARAERPAHSPRASGQPDDLAFLGTAAG
jgi:Na+-translocating ferredoxin:NAD+ oxidoreductase RnfD subunit